MTNTGVIFGHGAVRVGVACVVAALAVVVLAGCTSTSSAARVVRLHATASPVAVTLPPGPYPLGSSSLCTDVNRLGWLDVQRINPDHVSFCYPVEVALTGIGRVRAIARALCGLPANTLVRGPGCLSDLGVVFALRFGPASLALTTVTVDPMGCGVVRGLGTPVRIPTTQFWQVLGVQMGLAKSGPEASRVLKGSLPFLIE